MYYILKLTAMEPWLLPAFAGMTRLRVKKESVGVSVGNAVPMQGGQLVSKANQLARSA
jgi:hypothetical protein